MVGYRTSIASRATAHQLKKGLSAITLSSNRQRGTAATTTWLTRHIDTTLWAFDAEGDYLPQPAGGSEEDRINRATWGNEWDVLFMRLDGLEGAYRASEMTAEQQERYQTIRTRLR